MRKLLILAAGGVGYVLGARAGRERYEQIKHLCGRVWNHPAVVEQRHKTTAQIRQRGPEVAAAAGQAAVKGMGQAAKSAATAGFQAAVGHRPGPVVSGALEEPTPPPTRRSDPVEDSREPVDATR